MCARIEKRNIKCWNINRPILGINHMSLKDHGTSWMVITGVESIYTGANLDDWIDPKILDHETPVGQILAFSRFFRYDFGDVVKAQNQEFTDNLPSWCLCQTWSVILPSWNLKKSPSKWPIYHCILSSTMKIDHTLKWSIKLYQIVVCVRIKYEDVLGLYIPFL